MRVVSFNVNGIRAAVRRGYGDWRATAMPDALCLQEVRAPRAAVPTDVFDGFHLAYHEGDRAGRNGVAVLSRDPPAAVRRGLLAGGSVGGPHDSVDAAAAGPSSSPRDPGGSDRRDPDGFDAQGRYIEVDLPGVTVASLYLPKGDVYGQKYAAKTRFLTLLGAHLRAAVARSVDSGRHFVVCGDFNIAPAEADIRSWKSNLRSEGFLPEERAWIGELVIDGPLVDVVRSLHPGVVGPFSWWSWRGRAFDNDAGWRIDHQLADPALAARATRAWVDRPDAYDRRLSDHAPVLVDYDL